LVLGFIPLFTFALGVWQIKRLKWKVGLIDEIDEKLAREPLLLPPRINLDAVREFAFRRVRLRGTWDESHNMLLGPRKEFDTHGYDVITPLRRADGSTILVNRGFIGRDFARQWGPRESTSEEVEIVALLRERREKSRWIPDNQPETGIWTWPDAEGLAEHAGGAGANVQPVLVEQIFEGNSAQVNHMVSHGSPVGRPPSIELRNMHAVYAATWFSLSLTTAFLFVRLVSRGRGQSAAFAKSRH